MSKRLRQAHYKLIEDELRYYHSTKKEILEKRANIVMDQYTKNSKTKIKAVVHLARYQMKWNNV